MEPWLPLVIAAIIFIVLVIIFRIARAYWSISLPIAYILAVFCLVSIRRFKPSIVGGDGPGYDVDVWYIIEASAMALALFVSFALFLFIVFKANPEGRCCVCFRLQREIQGMVLYDDVVPHSTNNHDTEVPILYTDV